MFKHQAFWFVSSTGGSNGISQALGEQPMQLQYSRAFGAKDILGDRCLPMLTHTQSGWCFVLAWHSLSCWVSMFFFLRKQAPMIKTGLLEGLKPLGFRPLWFLVLRGGNSRIILGFTLGNCGLRNRRATTRQLPVIMWVVEVLHKRMILAN